MSRPLVELELLGREEDTAWLRSTTGDQVLVGDPGAGKTYLVYRLSRDEGWGLFLAPDNEEEIANAIRDQSPRTIIVDDPQIDVARLERLSALRREIGARFSIVATTWKGCKGEVAGALQVTEERIRTLERLPRQLILRIYEQLGIEAPDKDLLELVDQASNKPGLATTLPALWLEGDWFSMLRGEKLARDVLQSVRRLLGRDEERLLAVFSLGGRLGMPTKQVREVLGLDALEMAERLSSLNSAGVLSEVSGDCLAVEPPSLTADPARLGFLWSEWVRLGLPRLP